MPTDACSHLPQWRVRHLTLKKELLCRHVLIRFIDRLVGAYFFGPPVYTRYSKDVMSGVVTGNCTEQNCAVLRCHKR